MSSSVRPVFLRGIGTLSPLGANFSDARNGYALGRHRFVLPASPENSCWRAPLAEEAEQRVASLRQARREYARLDRSVLFAMLAGGDAIADAGWDDSGEPVGVIVGSSRGATESLESAWKIFSEHRDGRVPVQTSPLTTLGGISSSVAQYLQLRGPALSHSITCSTALHGLGNALAWIRSGMNSRFLVGGSEAALTPFTFAQMQALRIYAESVEVEFPCRPFGVSADQSDTMVLGEGASMFAIEGQSSVGEVSASDVEILGFGWGIEPIESLTGISEGGDALSLSMLRALDSLVKPRTIDALIAHGPGTKKGDASEEAALARVFGNDIPAVVSSKWMIGHTFGASGAFGMEYALHLLRGGRLAKPGYDFRGFAEASPVRTVMVNAAGFGGNAATVILGCAER